MASVFSRIVEGEIPCFKLAEDDNYLAFLDINPLKEGHTLVIPKKEIDYIFDLDDDTLAGLNLFAKRVAIVLGEAVPCKRIGVVVIGLEVPHAHIHLIPMDKESDLSFSNKRVKVSPERFGELVELIRARLNEDNI